MRGRITYLFLLSCVTALHAQDMHFSQYNENPLLLNPAFAGAVHPFRASLSQRSQWRTVASPFKTFGLSVDSRFGKTTTKRSPKYGRVVRKKSLPLAAGLSLYKDNAGGGVNTLELALSLACRVSTGEKSFFSGGLQGAMVQKRFGENTLIFPNQFNGTRYDGTMQHYEQVNTTDRFRGGDVAAGILWYYGADQKQFATHQELRVVLGVSAYHLAGSAAGIIPGAVPPGQRLVAHALVRFAIPKTKYIFEPSFLMQSQGGHQELNGGCLFMYELGSPTHYTGYLRRSTIGLGGFYRRGDAVAILVQFEVNEQYAIGISYDVNYSGLSGVSRKRGGMELSLRYSPNKSFLYGQQ